MSSKAKRNKKGTALDTGRLEVRMQRHVQRAHTFTDRKKAASKNACRRPVAY
jgi:hypothetical protein